MKVIFFGTTLFSVEILKCLLKNKIDVVAIVSKPDKQQGRFQKLKPLPVKQFLLDNHITIPFFQPEKISTLQWEQQLAAFQPDLFIVVAFGEIIKKNILEIPKLFPLNIHASLLPKYRGAAPIHRAIIDGEAETGVAIMEMVQALDAGDVFHVEKVAILEEDNVADVERGLIKAGQIAIMKVLERFKKHDFTKIPQKDSEATYAHKITTQESQVDFDRSSQEIHNLIRGVTPFPGAWCEVKILSQLKRLKIKKARIVPGLKGEPKKVLNYERNNFIVATRDSAIALLEVQLEGKKSLLAKDFILGTPRPEFL